MGSLADANREEILGGKAGINLNVSLGTSKSESKNESTDKIAQGSNITAGGDIKITAKEKDITIQGSNVEGKNITLEAKENINLVASQNENKTEEKSQSKSGSIGVSINLTSGGIGINASANQAKGQTKENAITHNQTQVTAEGTLTINSGKDTTIIGSKASGEKVEVNVGGNLNIESLQDQQTYDEKNSSSGISISSDLGHKGTTELQGQKNKGKIDSDYESVTDQAGIYAGEGGFDIQVGKNTDLKGAVIASEATPDKNKPVPIR